MLKKSLFVIFLVVFAVLAVRLFLTFSPVSELVSPWENGRAGVNLWFPLVQASTSAVPVPDLTAKAAYFIDINSGQVLFEKDPRQRLPIASLVKIMTAVVTLENKGWSDNVLVSERAAGMEPDSMLLKMGESLTVEELLYGVFLVSANDSAEALAETSTKSREDFLSQMNTKAVQLGMRDTVFINPTGLEEDGREQYSTAYDVAIMARYAIKNFPHLVDISSAPHIILPETPAHQDYDLYSGINLLTTYPGVLGFKTGYTPEAGLTLVTLAEKEGHKVLGVLLGSQNRREEAKELLDYSFSIR
ncbi:MAG: Serine-type D-Ala-D-Ala carboxypeptidase [Candidatus Daviesbacteria bacterium GW2011_GWA2_42_7]|uniref:Serine-type D-Ala-D-Ala carboxypeptidase n=1 Tax=Candidatus Daviesbacteria bacterium GW2011_GWA2_42_7 TaxID=1618425 RepID=A0A0G1BC55_9BACT|nr:MAG: Serine-type D-Ala-D-Ala carboxypeptidase [Candidatus Daviesbacteria bacterium GW2011_GWA2_42_7]